MEGIGVIAGQELCASSTPLFFPVLILEGKSFRWNIYKLGVAQITESTVYSLENS